MHEIEPHYNWLTYYDSSHDVKSPFYGKVYDFDKYADAIYGYYIDPAWDFFGSETLYCKILFADYDKHVSVIEFIGEWNDTLYNDIMHLKRNVVEPLLQEGINQFVLVGENIFNFHGSDDSYYEEWFDEVEDGWIAAINFPDFIQDEFKKYQLDNYINMGGTLMIPQWRTLHPVRFTELVGALIQRRLS